MYGTDYDETFAPTARMTSIRVLMQLAAEYGLILHQMDVKNAYLNAPIDYELYVEQPQGYEEVGISGEKLFWKLKKSSYGLKQSGRNWNLMIHEFFSDNGFSQSTADPCVHYK